MRSSTDLPRLSLAAILGLVCAASGQAATEVHEHAGSTTITTQRGGGRSTTRVIRTPDGQKVITRDGSNTDVSIQHDGARGDSRSDNRSRFDSHRGFDDSSGDTGPNARNCGGESNDGGTSWWRRWFGRHDAPSDTDSGDCDRRPAQRSSRSRMGDGDAPSAREFKERMRERMRPVFPRP